MNKLFLQFVISLFLISMNLYSQEDIKTEFYKFKVPEKTIIKTFASTHEKFANIDAYQFITNEKPKYILYLMSNKTNKEISNINIDNYKDFLFDLGKLNVSGVENFSDVVKINFTYEDNDIIKGIVYVSVNKDILNRYVFNNS